MKITPTRLPEVLVIEPRVFGDERGFFMESWNQKALDAALGQDVRFVQDNHSRSARGVLRGLHYQLTRPQGKLVRVAEGRVFDVAVDLRRSSPRLGQWVGAELTGENKRQMWIPPGFAHGFLVLSAYADFLYKTTEYYEASDERALRWNDPKVGVVWQLEDLGGPPTLSPRDSSAKPWSAAELFD